MKEFKKQQGFTLIELVVVIVLLGILAVTAAPKFIDLQTDAKTATLQAVKASMQSASSLVHGKSLIAGNETLAGGASGATVIVNGATLDVNFGYPRSNDSGAVDDWQDILLELNTDEFTVELASGIPALTNATVIVYPTGNAGPTQTPANCYAFYTEVQASGVPTIDVADCE